MFHLFNFDEDHEPGVLSVLLGLILAIPFCLAWVMLLVFDHKEVSSSVATVFSNPDTAKQVTDKVG